MQTGELLLSTLHRGLHAAVPLLLAATGELLAERAGLLNIGVEGMMLTGALAAAAAGWATGSAWIALAAGMTAAALVGLLFAVWTVCGARDQIVTGLAVNLLALGLTGASVGGFERRAAAVGAEFVCPRFGQMGGFDPIAWASPLIVAVVALFMSRSRGGMTLRAIGENPAAAAAAGIPVVRLKIAAVVAGAALAGLAGAYLVTAMGDRFQEGMTGGRGFIALALVIFGRWSAPRIAAAALFFGLLDALQVTLQPRLGARVHVLYPLLIALPYVLTLVVLAGRRGRALAPAGLTIPYRRVG